MTQEPGLKPCPFCGLGGITIEEKWVWNGEKENVLYQAILSHWCKQKASIIRFSRDTREQLFAAWNERK